LRATTILWFSTSLIIILGIMCPGVTPPRRRRLYQIAVLIYLGALVVAAATVASNDAYQIPAPMGITTNADPRTTEPVPILRLESLFPAKLLLMQVLFVSIGGLLSTRYTTVYSQTAFPYLFFAGGLVCLAALTTAIAASVTWHMAAGFATASLSLQAMALVHFYRFRHHGHVLQVRPQSAPAFLAELLPEFLLLTGTYLCIRSNLNPLGQLILSPNQDYNLALAFLLSGVLTRSWFGIYIPVRSLDHSLPLENGYESVLLILAQVGIRFAGLLALGTLWYKLPPNTLDHSRAVLPYLVICITASAIARLLHERQLPGILDLSGRLQLAFALLALSLNTTAGNRIFLLQIHLFPITATAIVSSWVAAEYCKQRRMLIPVIISLLSLAAAPPLPQFFIRSLLGYQALITGQYITVLSGLFAFSTATVAYARICLSFYNPQTQDSPQILLHRLDEAAASREFFHQNHTPREVASMLLATTAVVLMILGIPLFEWCL